MSIVMTPQKGEHVGSSLENRREDMGNRSYYDELEDFPFSNDVLYLDNEWWADSDNEEFGPSHFRDLVALALCRLVQNPYWTCL
jgi:hypothetical protein